MHILGVYLPVAMQGAIFHDRRYIGKFQGAMIPTTPIGCRVV